MLFSFGLLVISLAISDPPKSRLDWPRIEKWYRWGEYDSLINVVRPWSQSALPENEKEYSKAFAFYGVALHALGDSLAGDSAFIKSLTYQPSFRLNRRFVSERILGRFLKLIPKPKPILVAQIPPKRKPILETIPSPPARPNSSKNWVYWCSGYIVVAATIASLYWLQPNPPEDIIISMDLH